MLLALSCCEIEILKIVDLAALTADYEAKDGDMLTGIMDGNYRITIADGATVKLKNAVVYGVDDRNCKWAGITLLGDATLVLEASNIMRGFDGGFPGIFVPKGKTLTLTGNGKLDVSSNGYAPGIGGDDADSGNIVIQGGTIRATGGKCSAAIGSGRYRSCGDITISGGSVTVHGHSLIAATAIGSGCNARCGNILISGGTVTAEGGYKSAGIGTSERGSVGNITITNSVSQVMAKKWDEKTPHSIGGGVDYVSIGTVTVGGKVGPVSESPFVYKP